MISVKGSRYFFWCQVPLISATVSSCHVNIQIQHLLLFLGVIQRLMVPSSILVLVMRTLGEATACSWLFMDLGPPLPSKSPILHKSHTFQPGISQKRPRSRHLLRLKRHLLLYQCHHMNIRRHQIMSLLFTNFHQILKSYLKKIIKKCLQGQRVSFKDQLPVSCCSNWDQAPQLPPEQF